MTEVNGTIHLNRSLLVRQNHITSSTVIGRRIAILENFVRNSFQNNIPIRDKYLADVSLLKLRNVEFSSPEIRGQIKHSNAIKQDILFAYLNAKKEYKSNGFEHRMMP